MSLMKLRRRQLKKVNPSNCLSGQKYCFSASLSEHLLKVLNIWRVYTICIYINDYINAIYISMPNFFYIKFAENMNSEWSFSSRLFKVWCDPNVNAFEPQIKWKLIHLSSVYSLIHSSVRIMLLYPIRSLSTGSGLV